MEQIIEQYIAELDGMAEYGLSKSEVFSEEKNVYQWAIGIHKVQLKITNTNSLQVYVAFISTPTQLVDELQDALASAENAHEGVSFRILDDMVYFIKERNESEVTLETLKQDIKELTELRENLPLEIEEFLLKLRDNTIHIYEDIETCKSELEEVSYIEATYDPRPKSVEEFSQLPESVKKVVDEELSSEHLDMLGKHFPNIQVLERGKTDIELEILPPSLANLKYLQIIEIEIKDLQELPNFLFEYEHLLSLDLNSIYSNEKVTEIPKALSNLSKLKSLSLSGFEEVEEIPDLSNLQNLETLYITECSKLSKVPEGLTKLKSLRELNIDNCPQISEIPEGLATLPNLTNLSLGDNNISQVPDDFFRLPNIAFEKIWLSGNPINAEAEAERAREIAQEKKDKEASIKSHNKSAYEKPVEKLITNNEYEAIYVGTGVSADSHPLKDKISFIKNCPNCNSEHIHITYAKHQVHIHSGDEYYQYEGVCQSCGEPIKDSYSEN